MADRNSQDTQRTRTGFAPVKAESNGSSSDGCKSSATRDSRSQGILFNLQAGDGTCRRPHLIWRELSLP